MRNFRELQIWKESIEMSVSVYEVVKSFPSTEKFGLISQLTRCSVSIPSNIAEGCRGSDKELIHFLNISLGSSFELETQLEISYKIGYLSNESFQKLKLSLNILQKRMNAFRNTIKANTLKRMPKR